METIITPFVTAAEVVHVLTALDQQGYPLVTSEQLEYVFAGRDGLAGAIRAARRQGRIHTRHVWKQSNPIHHITLPANTAHLEAGRAR